MQGTLTKVTLTVDLDLRDSNDPHFTLHPAMTLDNEGILYDSTGDPAAGDLELVITNNSGKDVYVFYSWADAKGMVAFDASTVPKSTGPQYYTRPKCSIKAKGMKGRKQVQLLYIGTLYADQLGPLGCSDLQDPVHVAECFFGAHPSVWPPHAVHTPAHNGPHHTEPIIIGS